MLLVLSEFWFYPLACDFEKPRILLFPTLTFIYTLLCFPRIFNTHYFFSDPSLASILKFSFFLKPLLICELLSKPMCPARTGQRFLAYVSTLLPCSALGLGILQRLTYVLWSSLQHVFALPFDAAF